MTSTNNINAQSQHFQYLVIGGGSGGIASARRAAKYGASVCLIESGALGGTCVNVGCVPKKVMWSVANLRELIAFGAKGMCIQGIDKSEEHIKVDWAQLKEKRDAYVHRLNGIYGNNLKNDNITVLNGKAKFVGPKSVQLLTGDNASSSVISADHILIATGAHPHVPHEDEVPGSSLGITSDGFFHNLTSQPKKVAIIGTGYIGVEIAGIFNSFGSKVTIFSRHFGVLKNFDHFVSENLVIQMKKNGIEIVENCNIERLEKQKEDSNLTTVCYKSLDGKDHGCVKDFDVVMWATGRTPNSKDLGLDSAGIKANEYGFILADEWQNTNVSGVYALGDVCGKAMLTPVAIAAGRKLADRLFGGQSTAKMDYSLIPTVIFSHPPIGSIGMIEEEAVKAYGSENIKIYSAKFTPMSDALLPQEHKSQTCYKLVCLKNENEKIIGLHILGKESDEIMQGFSVAIKMGATKADFDSTVAIHPTAGEELVTMK